jgi:glycosyltransferase involved in cell wall biosynthesis
MSDLPRITIITTSYNQGPYLEQAIRSVLDQGYPNLEYFVVDGGSTDNSVEIIRKYERHITRWVSEKDRGQPDALNKGFSWATGDILGFINSDDWLEPGALDFVAKQFMDGSEWVVGWVRFIEPDGQDFPQVWQAYERVQDWFVTNPIPQQGTFFAGRLWKEFGGFRENLHLVFDYEFWLRLRFKAKVKPKTVRRCLGTYRLHASSKTVSLAPKYHAENEQVREEYMQFLAADELAATKQHRAKWETEKHRRLGWEALKNGDAAHARKHAMATFRRATADLESWRLMYCAMRGR